MISRPLARLHPNRAVEAYRLAVAAGRSVRRSGEPKHLTPGADAI